MRRDEFLIEAVDEPVMARRVAEAGDYALAKATGGVAFLLNSLGIVLAQGKKEVQKYLDGSDDPKIKKMLKVLKKSF